MEWSRLMSRRRLRLDKEFVDSAERPDRTDFERDYDRILFSTAFRRLHDKTQVFPLPEDDLVHSRLTHSLEVASVGRSLGRLVGKHVVAQQDSIPCKSSDFGDVVAVACLAHDIGNPPLGHAGEDAIGAFFHKFFDSPAGARLLGELTDAQRTDLLEFEGNAQGLRILVRLQNELDNGLKLTAATLSTLMKYPCESTKTNPAHDVHKKFGFFQAEKEHVRLLADDVGLVPVGSGAWARHPLAFLVEAADDICYSILDIEDGVRLKHVDKDDAKDLLRSIARGSDGFSEARASISDTKTSMAYLRAHAITKMVRECADAFMIHEAAILEGTHTSSITKDIPSRRALKALKELASARCYASPDVVAIELAGYESLGGLLECFVPVAVEAERKGKLEKAHSLLVARGVRLESDEPMYERVMRIVDFVSGMTDRFALALYRRIKGISIPGRVE